MNNAQSERNEERPIFSYSLTFRFALDIILIVFIITANIYFSLAEHSPITAYPLILIAIGAYDLYWNWRKPLRKIRFYDTHLEVSGWKVNLRANYDQLEDLSRAKRIIGDFRSGSAVWFSIKDDPNEFMVPNRKLGKPKVELYSWLLQKNPNASGQAP